MGYNYQRRLRCRTTRKKQFNDRAACFSVKIASGFVRKDDFRPGYHSARYGNPLLLATGQLCWIMADPMTQAHGLEFGQSLGEGIANTVKFQRHGDVFQRRHGRQEMEGLQHDANPSTPCHRKRIFIERPIVDTRDTNLTLASLFQPCQNSHQRGFSRSGWPQYRNAGATLYIEINALQNIG